MLSYFPQLLVKYWKISEDEAGNDIIEIISDGGKTLILEDHYVNIWKLIDGNTGVEEIVSVLETIYSKNSHEEVKQAVENCLTELESLKLIIINWNPMG